MYRFPVAGTVQQGGSGPRSKSTHVEKTAARSDMKNDRDEG
jgi:hypothetical protein